MYELALGVLTRVNAVPTPIELGLLLAVLPATCALLERLCRGRAPGPVSRRSFLLNVTYWLVNPLVIQPVSRCTICVAGLGLGAALGWTADEHILDGFGPLARQPLWAQALETLALTDLVDYWTHRWFHSPRAWRFHAIHHSPEQMTWAASARMHPVNDIVTRVCQVVPVVLLGLSIKAILLVVPVLVVFVIVLHSNLNWDYGPFRWVLVSPLYHRWHHTTDPEGLDKNFAGIFPIWDLLFGTAHFPRHEPMRFGVNHNPPPETFWGQLLYPFCGPAKVAGPEDDRTRVAPGV